MLDNILQKITNGHKNILLFLVFNIKKYKMKYM